MECTKEIITMIIPCFNEEEAIPYYYQEMKKIKKEMQEIDLELLFVDDGSSDRTLEILKQLHEEDKGCNYLSFSRNFGKEAAIYAGLQVAEGDYIGIMDVDLQDPPELLPEMYRILKEEPYDGVAARRSNRKGEGKIRSFLSEQFYKVINRISQTEIVNGARDYRLMKRKVAQAALKMCEYNRFSKGIFQWIGFRTKWLEFENVERSAGKTKWSLRKLFLYSLEGITGFSVAPLSLAFLLGTLFCLLSVLTIVFIIIRKLVWGDPVSGWPSLACLILMVGGVQLFCTGIIGQYLAKTYLETKKRPIYILQESSRKFIEDAEKTKE